MWWVATLWFHALPVVVLHPAALGCPTERAVQEAIEKLHVPTDASFADATWVDAEEGIRLVVSAQRTSSAAPERLSRVFPRQSCDRLAELVALTIDRALRPIGPAPTPDGDRTIDAEEEHEALEAPLFDFDVAGGPFVVLSPSGADFGGEVELQGWPHGATFGAVLRAGATGPRTYTNRDATLRIFQLQASLGAAARFALSERFAVHATLGAALTQVRGEPGGVDGPVPVRDLRPGLRADLVLVTNIGPLDVRAGVAARAYLRTPVYRAVPSTTLVSMSPVEVQLYVALGFHSGEAP